MVYRSAEKGELLRKDLQGQSRQRRALVRRVRFLVCISVLKFDNSLLDTTQVIFHASSTKLQLTVMLMDKLGEEPSDPSGSSMFGDK